MRQLHVTSCALEATDRVSALIRIGLRLGRMCLELAQSRKKQGLEWLEPAYKISGYFRNVGIGECIMAGAQVWDEEVWTPMLGGT